MGTVGPVVRCCERFLLLANLISDDDRREWKTSDNRQEKTSSCLWSRVTNGPGELRIRTEVSWKGINNEKQLWQG